MLRRKAIEMSVIKVGRTFEIELRERKNLNSMHRPAAERESQDSRASRRLLVADYVAKEGFGFWRSVIPSGFDMNYRHNLNRRTLRQAALQSLRSDRSRRVGPARNRYESAQQRGARIGRAWVVWVDDARAGVYP